MNLPHLQPPRTWLLCLRKIVYVLNLDSPTIRKKYEWDLFGRYRTLRPPYVVHYSTVWSVYFAKSQTVRKSE